MTIATEFVIHRAAVLSDDGRYRYHMARWWNTDTASWWEQDRPVMGFIMLNPSKADASIDDPTTIRCIGFAQRHGCGAINIANLFALRATNPSELLRNTADRVGPHNDTWIDRYLDVAQASGGPLVAAWGAHKAARDRSAIVATRAASRGVTMHCLGRTVTGAPRHPLYLKDDTPLEVWP